MLKFLFSFFFIVFASSCVSNKPAYDTAKSSSKLEQSERNIAYLKNISQLDDNNYDFISSQMQTLIRNYKRMKKHLSNIEDKLDTTLKKLESYTYKSLLDSKNKEPSSQVEDEIRITNKEDEEVILSINKLDDYKYIMGELVAGDYNTSELETERALNLLKNKLETAQNKLNPVKEGVNQKALSPESEKMKKLSEGEEAEEYREEPETEELFDEDSLMEKKVTDELDLFSQEKIKDSEENDSAFLLGKQLFKKKSYEMAVSELQKYRNENPEGKYYLEATFYIGQAFEKLQMPIEAKIFFQEIVKTDSDSLWAVKAKEEIEK